MSSDPASGDPSAESLERLASRLALLVSADSEADNAGRAAGALARRLGLSGGQLKAMFLAGAAAVTEPEIQRELAGTAAGQAARQAHVDRETATIRNTMEHLDLALRQSQRDRDQLRQELNTAQEALDRARTSAQVQRVMGGLLLLALLGGGLFAAFGPNWHLHDSAALQAASGMARSAVVRGGGAVVYSEADATAAVLARLPAGSRVGVHQLVWHKLNQWAETPLADQTGYIAVTDLDFQ